MGVSVKMFGIGVGIIFVIKHYTIQSTNKQKQPALTILARRFFYQTDNFISFNYEFSERLNKSSSSSAEYVFSSSLD